MFLHYPGLLLLLRLALLLLIHHPGLSVRLNHLDHQGQWKFPHHLDLLGCLRLDR